MLTTLKTTIPGMPASTCPEQRAHEAIRQVLAEALDGGAAAGGRIHVGGVSSDERAHSATRTRKVVVADRSLDPPHVVQQIPEREQAVEKECVDEPRQKHRYRDRCSESRDDDAERDGSKRDEQQHAASVPVEPSCAQPPFDPRQRRADEPDGMPGIHRIANDEIGDDTRRQQCRAGRKEPDELI